MRKIIVITFLLLLSGAAFGGDSGKWANFEGNKIHYYDIGGSKKGAIVFIHGWTCSADFWKDSLNAFPGYRVIAIDLIGHGQSDKPKAVYSMEYFARSVDAVLKNAGVKRAVLVGHSMGTPVARQFYRLFPEKTLGLVVVDGALRPYGTKQEMDQYFSALSSNYKEMAPKFIDGMLQPVKDEKLREMIRTSMLATPDYVALSATTGMIDEKIWADDKLNVPVLAIMANSPGWKPDIEASYKMLAPNLEFHMWNGVSHFLMMEKPKEFNEQVKGFVVKNKLL